MALNLASPEHRKSHPKKPDYFEHRARCYEIIKDLKLAAEDRKAYLVLKPDDGFAHLQLGWHYEKLGELDQAIACFERASQIKECDGHSSLIRIYSRRQKFAEASRCCEQLVAKLPDECGVKRVVAWFLATCPDSKFRDGQRAVKVAKKALTLAREE